MGAYPITTQCRILKHYRYIAVENLVRKGETPCYKQFLLFSQCFLPYMALLFYLNAILLLFDSIWINCTILSSGKGLMYLQKVSTHNCSVKLFQNLTSHLREEFLTISSCLYSTSGPHHQSHVSREIRISQTPEEHLCKIISKSDQQFKRRRIFKNFFKSVCLFVCLRFYIISTVFQILNSDSSQIHASWTIFNQYLTSSLS